MRVSKSGGVDLGGSMILLLRSGLLFVVMSSYARSVIAMLAEPPSPDYILNPGGSRLF